MIAHMSGSRISSSLHDLTRLGHNLEELLKFSIPYRRRRCHRGHRRVMNWCIMDWSDIAQLFEQ
jgi:hypothetical protein